MSHYIRRQFAALAAVSALLIAPLPLSAADEVTDLTPSIQARGIDLGTILVIEAEGIVILRGKTSSVAKVREAVATVKSLGYQRVANLIQIVPVPDDKQIERSAERALSIARSLEGCRFTRVSSSSGVVTVTGQVQHESQMDAARQIVRTVEGVRDVRLRLNLT